jgi:hypothetical protein
MQLLWYKLGYGPIVGGEKQVFGIGKKPEKYIIFKISLEILAISMNTDIK